MRRLELDAGNTFIKWRLIEHEQIIGRGRWLTAEFRAEQLQECEQRPDVVWLASVAGDGLNQALAVAVKEYWQVSLQRARSVAQAAGVRNSYADPSRMGVDRWLAMLAAWKLVGRSCCVVDCGSAITVDLLDDQGRHQGGYILPGIRLMQQSLLGNTAEVRVDRDVEHYSVAPGCDTSSAVAHGANLLLLSLAQQLRSGVPGVDVAGAVLVTGGDGAQLASLMPGAELCPDLVMDGLRWALE
ncbi:type III pantothenate kinase [Marinobacterium sediminicola]|uniref:Type III pantothenate kinase n=1 Tax=Marinobacterium sediminicola TaxID=518898 RepID=A0ABY1RZD9_9GAMM|nr:type III pantothenate kinase [Marinobacterium sediminicola]ULG69046.1 type III pantothenate kinase [Marinobacterium sediminicola]SMR73712.1 type III pantothenate kinase [Marinobacterium sediminicola]